MRSICFAALGFLMLFPASAQARSPWSALADLWRAVWSVTPRLENSTQSETADGIRQALTIASRDTQVRLAADGLSDDMRIALPGRLGEAQAVLAPLGKGGALDALDAALNGAAEDELPAILAALGRAAESLPITDAIAIARSGDAAASDYLRQKTANDMKAALEPLIEARLNEKGAFEALLPAAALAGAGPPEATLRKDFIRYATDATVASAFRGIAAAEIALRHDEARHNTPELRAAFAH